MSSRLLTRIGISASSVIPSGVLDGQSGWTCGGRIPAGCRQEAQIDMVMTHLPYSCPLIDEDDVQAVTEALRDPIISQGERLAQFEGAFAAHCAAAFGVAFSSGTAALHGMCVAAGLGAKDEVIVPALTFAGTANAIRYAGARPVFADIDPDTLCLDPAAVQEAITPRTRAILSVDFAGHASAYGPLREIADDNGLLLLSDAAHAPGGKYHGHPVGSLADMTAFSFNPVKNLTSAEGGMVTTDDPERAARMRRFRVHGMTRNPAELASASPGDWYYEQSELGFNYKLSELHAALGLSQLGKLEAYNGRRRRLAARYDGLLGGFPVRLPTCAPGVHHVYHLYVIRVTRGGAAERARLFAFLRGRGFGVQVHYIPVPNHPDYRRAGFSLARCPRTAAYYDEALSIPLHQGMEEEDLLRVVSAIGAFFD